MPKKETVRLELSSSNRSSKTLTHKTIDLKLHSTAYPQLNTVIIGWYQQALGHLELHAEVNSSPYLMDDRHKLTAQLIIFYSKTYFQNQDTRVSALIAITKPIQKLDVKVKVNHYSMGPESKTSLLIGYAPGRFHVSSFSIHPSRPSSIHSILCFFASRKRDQFNGELVDATWPNVRRGGPRELHHSKLQLDAGRRASRGEIEADVRAGCFGNLVQRAQRDRTGHLLGQIGGNRGQPQLETRVEIGQFRQRHSRPLQIVS